mmetsp:Transcript_8921/g.13156  ORF Transcript_8921/g.13156 Transcript_8921/m.13156 type:complete len:346 (+) Transcript_8921:171-1208(+)
MLSKQDKKRMHLLQVVMLLLPYIRTSHSFLTSQSLSRINFLDLQQHTTNTNKNKHQHLQRLATSKNSAKKKKDDEDEEEYDEAKYAEWERFAPYNRCGREKLPEFYITRYGRQWFERYEEMREYQAKHGDCMVPVNNVGLGNWVHSQRVQYDAWKNREINGNEKEIQITSERVEALEELGFCFEVFPNAPRSDWSARYQELCDYKEVNGNANVPAIYPENSALGIWVKNQRMDYKRFRQGQKHHITKDRIQMLNDIGFVWNLDTPWEKRLEELIAYKKEYGDCNVPQTFKGNRSLAIWVKNMRAEYRKYESSDDSLLSEERIKELESLGFKWSLRNNNYASVENT